jgi:DNA (cytosine-5)-methyltransferase 1
LLFGVKRGLNFDQPLRWDEGLAYPNRKAFDFPWADTEAFVQDAVKANPNSVPLDLTVQYWFDKNDVEAHPNQIDCFTPRNGLSKFLKISEGDVSRKSSKRLHRWRYSPTAAYGNNEVHLHPYKARRISVAEALAIQSMPKEFELPPAMTLSNKFKTVGNGVPFKLGSHIARAIKQFLQQHAGKEGL